MGGKRRKAPKHAFQGTRPFPAEPRLRRDDLIYRLKAWPRLPESGRTAEIYRMLSVMSSQPVNRKWLVERCRMGPQQLDTLLAQLVREGALEVIDPAAFAGREPARA
ncbi:MAG TPA: hypothetical protein VGD76_02945 [Ramlibacter sp.]